MQFLRACNFYFWGFVMLTQFPRSHNFYVFIIHIWAQFLRVYNFYYFVMLVRIQFPRNIISTRARSAPAKKWATISTMRQFLRFRKWSFATISTCEQFLHFLSSECVTILAQCNFHTISRPDMRLRGGKLFYIPGTPSTPFSTKRVPQRTTRTYCFSWFLKTFLNSSFGPPNPIDPLHTPGCRAGGAQRYRGARSRSTSTETLSSVKRADCGADSVLSHLLLSDKSAFVPFARLSD